ncbi:type 2 lanthipeptide synthetase LanM family protein [Aquimarina brevivitae]|nr:type 2 lanthipeptide synthetase LanM family protein [Aquimarina brevivitae]
MEATLKPTPKPKQSYDYELAETLNATLVMPELWQPDVDQAKEELSAALYKNQLHINPKVFDDLIGWYTRIIARSTNTLLVQRYSSYFLTLYPLWRPKRSAPGNATPGATRHKLDAYMEWEQQQGIFSEQNPYPELMRLVHQFRTNWLAASIELLTRISAHANTIGEKLLAAPVQLRDLTSVTFGISDPHHNGRTAAILHFGAQKVVYKPRSLDGEYGWNVLVANLMDNGLPYSLYLPKILRYQDYGFMEFIATTSHTAQQPIEDCFEQYGAIMAIAHAFGTYDLHHENIIVGEHGPVVIDAEPLFRCVLSHSEQGENRLKLDKSISLEDIDSKESVMDIGILPHSMLSKLNEEEDAYEDYLVGALYPFALKPMKEFVPCGIGSDHLQMEEITIKASAFPNLPHLYDEPQLPVDHIDAIEEGFAKTHTFLVDKRAYLLNEKQLLAQLSGLHLRLLVRPTMHYALLYFRSISPQLLTSKKARAEKIASDLQLLGKMRLDSLDNITAHEIENLLDGDIPRFEVQSDGSQAYDTPLMFSPVQLAKERYERLNALDLQLQLVTIREKLIDRTKSVAETKHKSTVPQWQAQHAYDIIQSIVDATGYNQDDPFWTYTAYAPGYGSTMVHADREAFYDGALGTAVAIAEAGKLAANDAWLGLAKAILNPILNGEKPACIERGAGMARGLGGLIYAMLRIAEATQDQTILDKAVELAIEHSKYVLSIDVLDEVLHGKSGLLLALTAIYKRRPNPKIKSIMDTIANTLIKSAQHLEKGSCWKVLDGHSLPNMSHGTSGIAMALSRWYVISKDEKAKHLILEALRYDNSFWDTKEDGWIDARVADVENEQSSTWTWCNGRSGGLLARLAIYNALELPFKEDPFVKKALDAKPADIFTEAAPGLCCGSAGLVDTMITLHQICPSAHTEAYKDEAVALISLQSPRSHYCNLTAALFTGTAGLAFSLLRAAYPNKVNSILWFD